MNNVQPSPFAIAEAGKCIGCKACELACFAVHNDHNGVVAAVGTVTVPVIPRLHVIRTESFTLPVQCRQCENAPCAEACPVQAIRREEGTIVIHEESCIGCKGCAMACPFGAVSLDKAYSNGKVVPQIQLKERQHNAMVRSAKVIAYKCDLCRTRDHKDGAMGNVPACVEVCPVGALSLVHPDTSVSRSRTAAAMRL
ncbi:4Fe-4S dicluster domain-containing protein [Paenibacillus sp. CN-4]|uniref:4Fe-4S dicluster domain-containing protein n=1 Tax=Paenibacillus nanchangensis TaxID=3348343 RepID=UPI00397B3FD3